MKTNVFPHYLAYLLAEAAEDKRHQRALAKLRVRLHELQAKCPHPRDKQSYHPDPAGDMSESYYECSLCGRQS